MGQIDGKCSKKAVFHNFTHLICKREKYTEQMKKLILNPKKDTITICLPTEWVGKTLMCILKEPYEMEDDELVSEVSEAAICYHVGRYRKPRAWRRVRRKGHHHRKH